MKLFVPVSKVKPDSIIPSDLNFTYNPGRQDYDDYFTAYNILKELGKYNDGLGIEDLERAFSCLKADYLVNQINKLASVQLISRAGPLTGSKWFVNEKGRKYVLIYSKMSKIIDNHR